MLHPFILLNAMPSFGDLVWVAGYESADGPDGEEYYQLQLSQANEIEARLRAYQRI